MKRPDRAGAVVVFAKVPEPGQVKTRMSPPLAPTQAAAFYAAMLEDVLEATANFADALGLEPVVALHPASACAEWKSRVPPGYRVIPQRGRSLAERMARAVEDESGGERGPVLLRGSDSPALPQARLAEALAALATHDIAIAPDLDGGYSLIGLNRPWPGLFSHPMSTDRVLADTLAQAQRLGARASLLEPCFDLDRFDDLRVLRRAREGPEAALCPRTLGYLDEARLWPASAEPGD